MKLRSVVLGVGLILLGAVLNLFTSLCFPLSEMIMAIGIIIFWKYFIR